MNQVKFKGKELSLIGNVIQAGEKLSFEAIDSHGRPFHISQLYGKKTIISVFPDITTSVCDIQTIKLAKYTKDHPEINFLSVTMNSVDTIQNWCLAKSVEHNLIVSDAKKMEFAHKTNLLIKQNMLLARCFILLNENGIIEKVYLIDEITDMPEWKIIDGWIG